MYTKKDTGYYVNRHSCFLLTYHVVLVTKYRKPVLQGKVKELVYRIIRDILEERDCTLKELNGELMPGRKSRSWTWCGSSRPRRPGLQENSSRKN